MNASIITIGDEILIGQIVDTNSAYLASGLNMAGVHVQRIYSISDDEQAITDTLDEELQLSDIIIITGGLGPTNDDITKKTLTRYFGGTLIENPETLAILEKFMFSRGVKLTDRNRAQALVPDSCEVLLNKYGTAPGMLFRKNGKWIVSLPGVPYEMESLFTEEFIPRLKKEVRLPVLLNESICIAGIAESSLSDLLKEWEDNLTEDVEVAYLPSPGMIRLRISLSGNNNDHLNKKLKELIGEAAEIIGPRKVFGYGKDTLESVVGRLLVAKQKTFATAESCTGGYISGLITSVPGASRYFRGCIVAYSNDIKTKFLGVDQVALEKHGAVSREVVELMAQGARKELGTDYAVATSGIAGPDGGTPEKPVGTVWVGVSSPVRTLAVKFQLGEHRERNIIRASLNALNLLRIEIAENP